MPPLSKPFSRDGTAGRLCRAAPVFALLGLAAPAAASSATRGINRAHYVLSNASGAIGAHFRSLLAGDMAAIQLTAFALSGVIALVGFWLLLKPAPWARTVGAVIALPDQSETQAENRATPADAPESTPPPPGRLLEAIAAAKAQLAISQAEEKSRKD